MVASSTSSTTGYAATLVAHASDLPGEPSSVDLNGGPAEAGEAGGWGRELPSAGRWVGVIFLR